MLYFGWAEMGMIGEDCACRGGISKDHGFRGFVFTFDELLDAPPAIDCLPLFDEIVLVP